MIKNIIALLALASFTQAANVTFQNFADDFTAIRPVATTSGDAIPNNSGFAAVGYFTISDEVISAADPTLLTSFVQFGSSIQLGGAGAFNQNGLYKGVQSQDINAGSDFIDKNIYTVIGNGASLETSTEVLVYKSAFTFAVDEPLDVKTTNIAAAATTPAELILGTFGEVQVDIGGTQYAAFQTVVIPEPASISMLGFGLLTMLRRKRR